MSRLACRRAQALSETSIASLESIRFIGVGFSGALSSFEPKKGGSRAFLSTTRENGETIVKQIIIESLGRDVEEILTSELILLTICQTLNIPTQSLINSLKIEGLTETVTHLSQPVVMSSFLKDDSMTHLLYRPKSLPLCPNPSFIGLVLPGSFNPLHVGHIDLARVAQAHHPELPLVFELAIVNVDKGSLEEEMLQRRLEQFTNHGVMVTKHSRFFEKAKLFPNCVFVVGADTAIRIVDKKYYGDDEREKIAVLSSIILEYKCKFLVAGRLDNKTNVFTTCEKEVHMSLPSSLVSKGFSFLTEDEFRRDISSTELRSKGSTL